MPGHFGGVWREAWRGRGRTVGAKWCSGIQGPAQWGRGPSGGPLHPCSSGARAESGQDCTGHCPWMW